MAGSVKNKSVPGIAGQGNFSMYSAMMERRRSSATTPETHGNRRAKSRAASKSYSIKFGY